MNIRYKLQQFVDIQMDGFDIKLPEETLSLITVLTEQVGSPTYIKTPVFNKVDRTLIHAGSHGYLNSSQENMQKKKRRNNKVYENINDEDWEQIRSFHVTQMEKKEGLDCEIDKIRSFLNKMSEKNYENQKQNIVDIVSRLVDELVSHEEIMKVGKAIFEIASNNRFYSKLYADLYTEMIRKFDIMKNIFEVNLESFMELFKRIEYANPDENYDNYCRVNRDNERRKSLSSFFVNLAINDVIKKEKMVELTKDLLNHVLNSIAMENKKYEVDEMIENISILYNKEWFKEFDNVENRDGERERDGDEEDCVIKNITRLAYCKSKIFPSLSNKSIFKCMDMIEM